jgi:hypothetical protein
VPTPSTDLADAICVYLFHTQVSKGRSRPVDILTRVDLDHRDPQWDTGCDGHIDVGTRPRMTVASSDCVVCSRVVRVVAGRQEHTWLHEQLPHLWCDPDQVRVDLDFQAPR